MRVSTKRGGILVFVLFLFCFLPSLFEEKNSKTTIIMASSSPLGIKVVCLSDTHGTNADTLPEGDLLLHSGDFTHFGKEKDFVAFGEWLEKQPHTLKIVVNGNHENNAFRDKTKGKKMVEEHGGVFLINEGIVVDLDILKRKKEQQTDESPIVYNIPAPTSSDPHSFPSDFDFTNKIVIYGVDFFWNCRQEGGNPYHDVVPENTSILLTHNPPHGLADKDCGCPSVRNLVNRVKPRLVVCGHIHQAHSVFKGEGELEGVTVVNAAMCNEGYKVGWPIESLDL